MIGESESSGASDSIIEDLRIDQIGWPLARHAARQFSAAMLPILVRVPIVPLPRCGATTALGRSYSSGSSNGSFS